MNKKYIIIACTLSILCAALMFNHFTQNKNIPTLAVANYGPHASLDNAIIGLKDQLRKEGFREGETIAYDISHVSFDSNLIQQMLSKLRSKKPKAMVVMTTPIAQAAKGKIHDIPLIFSVITDPVAAGLIKERHKADGNMTGGADTQDLKAFLHFAKSLLPQAKTVGLLYATSESNDLALLQMMKKEAKSLHMHVVAIPIEQSRDISLRMEEFKGKVDFIYVGTSGPIQPALPSIASKARAMKIPVFNVEEQAVKDGLALASFGIDYIAIGRNIGKIAAEILRGKDVKDLPPCYPSAKDHHGVINKHLAKQYQIQIPLHVDIVG